MADGARVGREPRDRFTGAREALPSSFPVVAERPHLCLFTSSPAPSGVGEHMLALASELRGRYRLSLVCPLTTAARRLRERARALGLVVLPFEVHGEGPVRERLCEWLRRHRVAIFHGHAGISWEGHDGYYAARDAGVPVIVRTEHLPYLLTDAADQREFARVLRSIDRLICVSAGVRDTFLAGGVPAHKLRVVRNGIDTAAFGDRAPVDRRAVRERLNIPSRSRLVLTVGRLTEQKGYRYLAEAIPVVVAGATDVHFVWVGAGDGAGELRWRLNNLGVAERVCLHTGQANMRELLGAADLFVLPSLFEGLPLVVLEALAAGVPVVGTRVLGTSEAIRDGVTGRLVPARDAGALAAAMLEVLDRPRLATRWAAAGRLIAERDFSSARMARETAAIYDELRTVPAPVALAGAGAGPTR